MTICYICDEETEDDVVCRACRKNTKLFISKTAAKTEYLLKDSDLQDLVSFDIVSNKFRKGQTITLYILKDVKGCAHIKYPRLKQEKAKREKAKVERKKNAAAKIVEDKDKRKQQVHDFIINNGGIENIVMDDNIRMYIDKGGKYRFARGQRRYYGQRCDDDYDESDNIYDWDVIIRNNDELEEYLKDKIKKTKPQIERKIELQELIVKENLPENSIISFFATKYIETGFMEVGQAIKDIKKELTDMYVRKERFETIERAIKLHNLESVKKPLKYKYFLADTSILLSDVITTMRGIKFFELMEFREVNDENYMMKMIKEYIEDKNPIINMPFELYEKYILWQINGSKEIVDNDHDWEMQNESDDCFVCGNDPASDHPCSGLISMDCDYKLCDMCCYMPMCKLHEGKVGGDNIRTMKND